MADDAEDGRRSDRDGSDGPAETDEPAADGETDEPAADGETDEPAADGTSTGDGGPVDGTPPPDDSDADGVDPDGTAVDGQDDHGPGDVDDHVTAEADDAADGSADEADTNPDGTAGTTAADDETTDGTDRAAADDETTSELDGAGTDAGDGEDDGSGGSFGPSDLVGAGEYIGNADESVDRPDEDAPESPSGPADDRTRESDPAGTATGGAPEPPAGDAPEPSDGELPEPPDGDAPEPPGGDAPEPPDGDAPEPSQGAERPPADLDLSGSADGEAPPPSDGDAPRPSYDELPEPPDGELLEPPDGDEPPSDPAVYTPDSGESGFTEGARPGPEGYERPDNMAETTPLERKTGPPEDQEMPLADHVEEMVSRLFIVVAIAGVVSVAIFPFGEEIIDFLWYQVLPGGDVAQPRVYHPLALVMTQLKVASLGGLIIALPVFVYQTYAFMKPGLYPHERRYYLAAVPTSLVLAFVGVTFAFYVILPAIFTYFLYYSDTVVTIAFALSDTFNLILLLMGYLAVVFQIPLFIMLAIMMGLVTRRWLENRRLYFWAAFLGISFIFNPDPTGMAPFLVTITMITLFEGTLLLLRWTGR